MKYGMDRAGNRLPIALYAWGSGQSALYSYIMIPFLLLEGLTVYTMRLPMALIGIASLYIIYYLLKNIFDNKKIALVGVAFLAICPWHIMKSRWGMEYIPRFSITCMFASCFRTKKEKYNFTGVIIYCIRSI